ncbi:MAG TPA: RidA family protein [Acidobacteriota bacterium]|nr:RidA family protein [Acidobacteriota bacterium]
MRAAVIVGLLLVLLAGLFFGYLLMNQTVEENRSNETIEAEMVPAQAEARVVREIIGGPSSGTPFSGAVKVGNTLYVSGQIAIDAEGNEVRDSIEAETAQALENIKRLVEAAGFEMSDVVKATVYLADMADYDAMNQVYIGYFPENPPARACVAVSALARGFKLEISAIAVK